MPQRAYRHALRCLHCGSNWMPKYGTSRGKQTYRCGDCKHRYTPEGNRHYYSEAVKSQAVSIYLEGSGRSAIGRVLPAPPETVYSWIKKSRSSPGHLRAGSGAASGGAAGRRSGGGHLPGRGVDLSGLPQGGGAARAVDLDSGSSRSRRAVVAGL